MRRGLSSTVILIAALGGPFDAGLAQQPAVSPQTNDQAPIEPKAIAVLEAACNALAQTKAMSFTAVNTYERAAGNRQPLYFTTLNQVSVQRPDKLRVITPADGVPDEFYYDGKTMMAYVPSQDLVAIADAPPTIDDMVNAAWEKGAIYFPFADFIATRPCDVFKEHGLNSAFYVGQSKVVGAATTDMIAVAADNIQAELWIGAQDHLPRLVRVVYPHEPAHALYQTEYSDWHLLGGIDPSTFTSEKAAKGKPMQFQPPGAGDAPPDPAKP